MNKQQNQQNKYIIGIDVSKNILHIYNLKCNTFFKIWNNKKEITNFFNTVSQKYCIVYEPTWIYWKTLEMVLNDLDLQHLQVHPNDMHQLIQSLGYKNKNDKLDSKSIAKVWEVLYKNLMDLWWKDKFITPNSNQINQLNHYMSQIRFMKEQIAWFKQWLEVIKHNPYDWKIAEKTYKNSINELEKSIEKIEEKIIEILKQLWLEENYKLLQTIPWVWPSIALEMIVFFTTMKEKWLKKSNKKELIAYTWLNPTQDQSGSSKDGSYISRKWDSNIRAAAYISWIQWCKWSETQRYYDTTIWKFTRRMKEKFSSSKNKRWKSIWCAVWKKIIETWRAIFWDGTEYNYS